MLADLYPLLFEPLFRSQVWGGRRLARWFPDLPSGPVGEAWVLAGHPRGRTRVRNGPLAGATLDTLSRQFGPRLLGARASGPFPLLVKLIDAEQDLSVQVHPADGHPGLPPGESGKTEMWVVLEARPGAGVICGLAAGVTPAALAQAVAGGDCSWALRRVKVQAGDVLYVPSGTVHALGAGVVVAEIQQSSDTTYRLYDYGRAGLDGRPRELHVADALQVIRYGEAIEPTHPAPPPPGRWAEIARSPYFVVEQGECRGPWPGATSAATCEALLVLDGAGAVTWPGGREPLAPADAALLPAGLGPYALDGSLRLLRVTLP